MELGSIERSIHVDAAPEVVFDVLTDPAHIRQWWWDADARLEPSAGSTGELVWGDRSSPDAHVEQLTVVEAEPPRRFAFRWTYDDGVQPAAGNSLLVTFVLVPTAEGTTVHLTESGFRERGWEAAVLEQRYSDHVEGWDRHFVGGLRTYLDRLVPTA